MKPGIAALRVQLNVKIFSTVQFAAILQKSLILIFRRTQIDRMLPLRTCRMFNCSTPVPAIRDWRDRAPTQGNS